MSRVLETTLTGRNLLSPVLAQAGRDVVAFNSTVAGANTKASTSAVTAAGVQDGAAAKIAASNVKASTSASASAQQQMRAHAQAGQSATMQARLQETANGALIRSNGLLGTSLTPLTAGLGATGLALGYGAFRGMEFGTAMSRVQAATQATGADMGRLREAAITMGADTQFSSVEAAAGITEMAKAGVSTTNIIGGGLKGALDLAAAGEMEVADAAEIGATALNVFRLEGTQMSHVADLLAAGAGKAQGSVHDLGMALNQSALVASATGLSIEETTGTLAAFASAGLIGSDAGTSFRSMLLHLQNPSKEAAETMAALGVNMYDAQGQFVGMESLAGQLQTQMRGLTQAERDKAMATIFGSDAVRAANILYTQGAKGIEQWTGKVNDAGYAARQAAQLNDNLRGDLERLGGAVDSFFTSLGEGAQGPLREAVQMLSMLVNAGGDVLGFFGDLPGPVQAGILAMAGWALVGDKVAGTLRGMGGVMPGMRDGWRSFGEALDYARRNGDGLGTVLRSVGSYAGGQALTGIKALGRAIGPELGIGLAVGTVSLLVSEFQRLTSASAEAEAAAEGLAGSLTLIDKAADRRSIRKAIEDTDGLAEALQRAGVSSETAISGLLGQAGAQEQTTRALQEYLTASRSGQFQSDDQKAVRQAVNDYIELATGYGNAASNARYFAGESEGAAGATDSTGTAAGEAAPQVAEYGSQLEFAADAASDARQQTDLLKTGLDLLTGATVNMAEVEAAFYEAVAQADGALEGLSGSVLDGAGNLNVQSEAGRKAQDVLHGVRDEADLMIATMLEQGATADVAKAKDAELRKSFYDTALQMTGSKEAAERLTNQIYGIPGERQTFIYANIDAAAAKIADIQAKINALKGKTVEVQIAAITGRSVANARYLLAKEPGFAGGGYTGDGDKNDVAGAVHRREFVVDAENTARHRPLLEAMHTGALNTGAQALGYGVPTYNAAGTGFTAAPAAPAAPAAMPGYGGGGYGARGGIDYDRLAAAIDKLGPRQTTVEVDARGFNADQMAAKVVQRLDERAWLSSTP